MVKEKLKGCSNINCSIRANCKRANISNRIVEEFIERNGRCTSFIKNIRKEKLFKGIKNNPLNINIQYKMSDELQKKLNEEYQKIIKSPHNFFILPDENEEEEKLPL